MAQIFYYDSVDLFNATTTDGTVDNGGISQPTFTASSSLVNEERALDQSISTEITSFAQNDALQINLGSAKSIDFFAVYFTASEADDLRYGYDTASSGQLDASSAITATFSPGWTVNHIGTTTKQYWYAIAAGSGGLVGLSEIIIGQRLEFEFHPDIGTIEKDTFATTTKRSMGGQEYGVRLHEPISDFKLNFANISSTFKTSLISMQDDVQDFKKFIWYDETNYHYVKLTQPIEFTEVAFERFSASINLRQQLN